MYNLALPKKIALGATMVRSFDQMIDAATGRVSGIGAAIVMRREGLERALRAIAFGDLDVLLLEKRGGRIAVNVSVTSVECSGKAYLIFYRPQAEPRLQEKLNLFEKQILRDVLLRANGIKKRAAVILGIDPRNMPYLLRKHRLTDSLRSR